MSILATIGFDHNTRQNKHGIKARLIPSRNSFYASGTASAPIACFFHGMADTGAAWDDVTDALPGHDVWVFDMPWSGVAGSNWSQEKSTAAWIEDAISLLPKAPSLCIGHSFGCTALMDWALEHPDTSANTNFLFMAPVYVTSESFPNAEQIAEFGSNVPSKLTESLRARLCGRHVKEAVLEKIGANLADRILPDALTEMFSALKRISENSLTSLMHRLTIIYGRDDESMVCSGTKALGLITASLVYELEDCGHNPAFERPKTVKKILSSFDEFWVDEPEVADFSSYKTATAPFKPVREKAVA